MKKGLLFVLFLVSFVGFGQCPSRLTSQSQIDNFSVNYPNCTSINKLDIEGEEIVNLNGLSQLTYIRELFVYFTKIQNFNGLENVEEMNFFRIEHNDELQDFSGLSSLISIGANPNFLRGFKIENNDNLISMEGLESLTSVYYYFDILENNSLQNLNGLNGLTTIHGNFNIMNTHLLNLNGLSNLNYVSQTFTIRNNFLENLSGLGGLTEIGEYLYIESNPFLENLDGLQNLTKVESFVGIGGNFMLNSIDGLSQMDPVHFVINENQNLYRCNINPVCEALAAPAQFGVIIDNNFFGCNSNEEVETQCLLFISESDLTETISIYPNPVSTIFNIETSKTISFEKAKIYSTLGKLIFVTSENQINLESLSEGIYFVEVVTDKGSVTKKIVKE